VIDITPSRRLTPNTSQNLDTLDAIISRFQEDKMPPLRQEKGDICFFVRQLKTIRSQMTDGISL
jgi:hypothetical protein